MGGGFGGKETQSSLTAVMAAMVAQKTGRPARLVLDRSDDMRITGKRHAYQADYRIAFDNNGRNSRSRICIFSQMVALSPIFRRL